MTVDVGGGCRSSVATSNFSKNANDLEFFFKCKNLPYKLKNNCKQQGGNSVVFSEDIIWCGCPVLQIQG